MLIMICEWENVLRWRVLGVTNLGGVAVACQPPVLLTAQAGRGITSNHTDIGLHKNSPKRMWGPPRNPCQG